MLSNYHSPIISSSTQPKGTKEREPQDKNPIIFIPLLSSPCLPFLICYRRRRQTKTCIYILSHIHNKQVERNIEAEREPQMLIKSTISSTKKFFKNTLQTFKSLLTSGGYQRVPKPQTSPFNNPFSSTTTIGDSRMHQSIIELDKFYADFTNRWDIDIEKVANMRSNKKVGKEEENHHHPMMKNNHHHDIGDKGRFMKLDRKRSGENERESCGSSSTNRGSHLVIQRLKELKLMDESNVDHELDIEEVIHYYSLLTCPAYIDIIDRFFVQVYSEFFHSTMAASNENSSKFKMVTPL